jgi:hypothetical protein
MTHQATQLPIISDPTDRDRLNLLFRTKGDTVSFADLRAEDPLEVLAWLNQPHIQPWHHAIAAAFREHREGDTQHSLSRALRDVTRILDLEANSTLRIRAVNAVIRLANAMKRANPSRREGQGWVRSAPDNPKSDAPARAHLSVHSSPTPRAAKELHHAKERVLDELSRLSINLERRAENKNDLEDAKAPIGTVPSWARDPLPPRGRAEVGLANIPSEPPRVEPPPPAHHSIENRKSQIKNPPAHPDNSDSPARRSATENRKSKIENPLTLSRGCPIPPAHKPRPRRRKPRAP